MSDYIKRKKAVNAIADMLAFVANGEFSNRFRRSDFVDDAEEWLEDVKPEDVAPVRRGRWIPFEDVFMETCYQCSECGLSFYLADGGTPKENEYHYCPNCGAKMDK